MFDTKWKTEPSQRNATLSWDISKPKVENLNGAFDELRSAIRFFHFFRNKLTLKKYTIGTYRIEIDASKGCTSRAKNVQLKPN